MSIRSQSAFLLVVALACPLSGQQPKPSAALSRAASSAPSTDSPGTAAEVLAFEKQMEAAVVRGDVTFLDKICASDFSFTHGDGWTTGGAPLRVEDRAHWLASISKAPYLLRELDSAQFRSSFMEMLRSLTDGIEPDIKPGIRNNANS